MNLALIQPNAFASIVCDLRPEQLWSVVADPTVLPQFSPELQEIRLLDEPVALGARFEGDQRRGDRSWTTVSTVTGFEPNRRFEWTVGDLEAPVSKWSFLIGESAMGTTLIHKVVLHGGPSPLSEYIAAHPDQADAIVHDRLDTLRARMVDTLEGIISLASQH